MAASKREASTNPILSQELKAADILVLVLHVVLVILLVVVLVPLLVLVVPALGRAGTSKALALTLARAIAKAKRYINSNPRNYY